MTEPTTERRAELAAMLADEAEFERAYPALTEYLRTVAALARSPLKHQRRAEDAFEVRVLHFLTGGASDNPYWDIVAPAISESSRRLREINGGGDHPSSRLRYAQGLLQATFAYAVPSPETLRWVAHMADGQPLIEIGAGRGYWANQLSRHGLDVTAYDYAPPGSQASNAWFPSAVGQMQRWYPVNGLRALALADRQREPKPAEHVLMLCWPPSWGHPMAARALAAYERRGGDRLVYIGETEGGRSAGPEFFQQLHERWTLVDSDATHVVWQGLNDVAQCWRRVADA